MRIESMLLRPVEQQWGRLDLPLRVELWTGESIDLGRRPLVTVRLKSPAAARYLAKPTLASLAEAYIEGKVDVEGDIWDMVDVAEAIAERTPRKPSRWRPKARSKKQDAEAIRYHYDVSNAFYELFLDRQMVYSCAYFKNGHEDLHLAQEQKLEHICRKLLLKPGEQFLDIGCGWGGLIRWAAAHHGVEATGVTLSREQYDYATARIREEGLTGRCRVLLCDYRDLSGESVYDKIASVGMFEHVGLKNLPVYFGAAARLLKEGGLMLNHGIMAPESAQGDKGLDAGDFIERYVFPLGELPPLSTTVREMAQRDLEVVDVECLRPHYAQTLAHWVSRLEAQRAQAEAIAGTRRYRIWRVYMAACAYNFQRGGVTIHQVLATKKAEAGLAPLPWTRAHQYHEVAPHEAVRVQYPRAVS